MTAESILALVVTAAVLAYLVYTLLHPEKF